MIRLEGEALHRNDLASIDEGQEEEEEEEEEEAKD